MDLVSPTKSVEGLSDIFNKFSIIESEENANDRIHIFWFLFKISNSVLRSCLAHLSLYDELELIYL
jgi:hypothetical protein